jgi:hypothetical protein
MSYKVFERNEIELRVGDLVMITYKDSRYYKNIGRIMHIDKTGDIDVRMECENLVVRFWKTNLKKVNELIETPSGEVVVVPYEDMIYLAAINIIIYDFEKQCYFFRDYDRWQIEVFEL